MKQTPYPTTNDGTAYTITTRYGAMGPTNLLGGGHYPMTTVLCEEDCTQKYIMRMERTEEEKKRRAEFGDKGATFSSSKVYAPRTDECSNTLSTVPKDNMLVEYRSCAIRTRSYANKPMAIEMGADVANALTSVQKDSMIAIMADPRKRYGFIRLQSETSPTLLSTDYKSPHLVIKKEMESKIVSYSRDCKGKIASRHLKEEANTLTCSTGNGGSTSQYVAEMPNRQDRIEYKEMPNGNIRAFDASSEDKRGVSEMMITDPNNPAQTLTCSHVQKCMEKPAMRIRKLTPRECFRLMDVDEDVIDRIQATSISKSQQYKLAGNSIVVSCLYHIFRKLFVDISPDSPRQLSIFDQTPVTTITKT